MNNFDRFKNKFSILEPFPLIIYDQFLTDIENNKICEEIKANNYFDTEKFGGRKQIRMGSKNYQNIIQKNEYLKNVSNFLNSEKTFKFLLNEINTLTYKKKYNFFLNEKMSYETNPDYSFFNKNQKLSGKFFDKIKKILNYEKNKISLQIDFSLSKKGYEREPHTDKPTRILVMLIYFNSLDKNDGGSLDIYKYKVFKEKYNSHPSPEEIDMKYSFVPKAKSLIIFESNPESVHSVSKMTTDKERVFAYGAYTMKHPVDWLREK